MEVKQDSIIVDQDIAETIECASVPITVAFSHMKRDDDRYNFVLRMTKSDGSTTINISTECMTQRSD